MKKILVSFIALIVALSGYSQNYLIYGSLTTDAEVPPCMNAGATASGYFVGTYSTSSNMLDLDIGFADLGADLSAAHIHTGVAGMSGGVVIPLIVTPDITEGYIQNTGLAIPQANEAALLSEGLYINIHTDDCTGGEIRGQIESLPITHTVNGDLSPEITVPPCTAGFGINTGTFTGYYNDEDNVMVFPLIDYNMAANLILAHIHVGEVGMTGAVAINLDPLGIEAADNSDNNADWFGGAGMLTEGQEGLFLDGNLYMNIHSESCAPGALRAQLMPMEFQEIPTLGQWGLIILGLSSVVFGLIFIRRRQLKLA